MLKDEEYYWMEVTKDEYQLPVLVADTRAELAEMLGVRPNYISSHMGKAKRGLMTERFVKVKREP